jgi:hypothetical protein
MENGKQFVSKPIVNSYKKEKKNYVICNFQRHAYEYLHTKRLCAKMRKKCLQNLFKLRLESALLKFIHISLKGKIDEEVVLSQLTPES